MRPSPSESSTDPRAALAPRPEDLAFARFARTGDADALAEVYDVLAPSLLRLAVRLAGDVAAAEDALQATFLAALQSADRWDARRPVRAWLTGILGNVVRDQRRSAARSPDPARLAVRPAPSDPADDAVHAELDRALDANVRRLPDAWQQPILLRVREGLSAEQIAALLGRPAGTIRAQISRGLARLRRGLAGALGLLVGTWGTRSARAQAAQRLPARAARLTRAQHATSAATLAPAGALVLGGLVMLKVLATVLGVGLVGTLAWLAWPEARGDEVTLRATSEARVAMELVPPSPADSPDVHPLTPPEVARGDAPSPGASMDAPEPEVEQPRAIGPLAAVVLDDGNVPVPEAMVETFADAEALAAGALPIRVVVSDDLGRCEVALSEPQVLVARHDESGRSAMVGWVHLWSEASRSSPVALVLAATCRLAGSVLDADGRPVSGAQVTAWPNGTSVPGPGDPRDLAPVSSDEQGRFAFDVDGRGHYEIDASLGGRRTAQHRVEVEPGATREVTLELPGDWFVAGRVVDPDGNPVRGMQVMLWHDYGGRAWREFRDDELQPVRRDAESDERGEFRFDVSLLGPKLALAWPSPDFGRDGDVLPRFAASELVRLELDREYPRAELTLVVPVARAIRGVVVDVDGRPQAGFSVSVGAMAASGAMSPHEALFSPPAGWQMGLGAARTSADGAFAVHGLRADLPYSVVVIDATGGKVIGLAKDVLAGGDALKIVLGEGLRPLASVSGRVVADVDGKPVTDYDIELLHRQPEGWTSWTITVEDVEGRFLIDELRPGETYALVVIPRRDARAPESERRDVVSVELPWFTATTEGLDVELRLPRSGAIEVEVLDAAGGPAEYAPLRASAAWKPLWRGYGGATRTDTRGRAELSWLVPGAYVVSATINGQELSASVEVVAGATARVSLRP